MLLESAILQVAHEACLIRRSDGPQPHGDGGELPEVRHQARVRIGRNAVTIGFATEVVQLLFAQTTFQIRPAVNARRRMTLNIDEVTGKLLGTPPEEVVEPDVVKHGSRCVGSDMAAHAGMLAGTQHHHQGVPADERVDTFFNLKVARIRLLAVTGNGVDVRRGDPTVEIAMLGDVEVQQLIDQIVRARAPFSVEYRLNRFEPFAGFLRILVKKPGLLCHRRLLL